MLRETASRLSLGVMVGVLLAACQLPAGAPDPKRTSTPVRPADDAPRKASPTPSAPAASPAPPALAKLVAPAGAATPLSGEVRLDAGYMVAAGAGNILSHNGGLIVAAGGLNLIGMDGASLVAAGAGNVISHNGGLILSQNGGQIVAAGAGNVVGHNGSQFRLAQAPDAAPTPPPGSLTAAAGVEIRVFELASGKAVALGVDAKGAPVYGVLTDAAGRYALFVPQAIAGNVLVQARVPGQADPRLAYDLVAAPGASGFGASGFGAAVDEDTALVTRYLRRAFARRLEAVLAKGQADEAALVSTLLAGTEATPELAALAGTTLKDFRDRVAAAGLPAGRHREVTERVTDVLIGRTALADIALDVTNTAWKGDPDEPALDAMRDILRQVREAAARKPLAFFPPLEFMVKANALRPAGAPELRVLKAADVGEVVVDAFLASDDVANLQLVVKAFHALGLDYTQADRLFAASTGIGLRLGTSFLADPEARAAVFAAIDAAGSAD